MHDKFGLSMAVAVLSLACFGPAILGNKLNVGSQNLMDFMIRTRDASAQHPQRSLACFDYYVPLLNQLAEEYEANYGACIKEGETAKQSVDENLKDKRTALDDTASSACELLSACRSIVNSVEYFECYIKAATDNTKTMYGLSADSSEILAEVREEYRLIDNAQDRCTNASERAYIEQSAETYDEFHSCLLGLSGPPTPAPGTTDASTMETTGEPTMEPAESTTVGSTVPDTEPTNPTTQSTTETTVESTTDGPVETTTEDSIGTTEGAAETTEGETTENTTVDATTTDVGDSKQEVEAKVAINSRTPSSDVSGKLEQIRQKVEEAKKNYQNFISKLRRREY